MPSFLITIDTEGDNLWDKPREIATRNAEYLPRFQRLCEACGLKPTYLTNYEMACCPRFQEFGLDVLRRGTAEIGMHLHAWNSPPLVPLTADDLAHQPYLIEYPTAVMRDKIHFLTDQLEDTFQVPMVSHRAGRWGLNASYTRLLVERGFRVDCSVTPLISWRIYPGDPQGRGGMDFTRFPSAAYWMDLDAIDRPGASTLLEVPVTIRPGNRPFTRAVHRATGGVPAVVRSVVRRLLPLHWLRPNGANLDAMLGLVQAVQDAGGDYLEFILHSSEFMPGANETFHTQDDIEKLYAHLEALFAAVTPAFRGATLSEYHDDFAACA